MRLSEHPYTCTYGTYCTPGTPAGTADLPVVIIHLVYSDENAFFSKNAFRSNILLSPEMMNLWQFSISSFNVGWSQQGSPGSPGSLSPGIIYYHWFIPPMQSLQSPWEVLGSPGSPWKSMEVHGSPGSPGSLGSPGKSWKCHWTGACRLCCWQCHWVWLIVVILVQVIIQLWLVSCDLSCDFNN